MQQSTSSGDPALELPGDLALDSVLDSSNIAPWSMEAINGDLFITPELLAAIIPNPPLVNHLADLLQLLPTADKYLFMQAFNADPRDQDYERLRSCDLRLVGVSGEPHLRFVARLKPTQDEGTRYFQGVVISARHLLAQPSDEYALKFLAGLFSESPIPSLIDRKSVV